MKTRFEIRQETVFRAYFDGKPVSSFRENLGELNEWIDREIERWGDYLPKFYNADFKSKKAKQFFHYKLADGTTGQFDKFVTSDKLARKELAAMLGRKRIPKGTKIWKE